MKWWYEPKSEKPKIPCDLCRKRVWIWWTSGVNWYGKLPKRFWDSHLCRECYGKLRRFEARTRKWEKYWKKHWKEQRERR